MSMADWLNRRWSEGYDILEHPIILLSGTYLCLSTNPGFAKYFLTWPLSDALMHFQVIIHLMEKLLCPIHKQ